MYILNLKYFNQIIRIYLDKKGDIIMKQESIFITGASGCVGHYVVDQLKKKYQLFLLVRNPEKLKYNPNDF